MNLISDSHFSHVNLKISETSKIQKSNFCIKKRVSAHFQSLDFIITHTNVPKITFDLQTRITKRIRSYFHFAHDIYQEFFIAYSLAGPLVTTHCSAISSCSNLIDSGRVIEKLPFRTSVPVENQYQ